MLDSDAIARYIDRVRSLYARHQSREHAYRPALEQLMRDAGNIEAINDPAQSEHGAPDFIFLGLDNPDIILGYAEAKDIGVDLQKVEESDQMHRYAGYQNLLLTDYLEFRFFADGERYELVRIGEVRNGQLHGVPENYPRFAQLVDEFFTRPPESIKSGKRLAEIMGAKARRIRDDVIAYFSEEPGDTAELAKIFNLMRSMLVHDLDQAKFADMYAQTLVYGLFVARYNDDSPETFTRAEARDLVPKTNPFLLSFFDHIAGPNFDQRLARAVDELCAVFRVSDVKSLVYNHLKSAKDVSYRDPVIYFYEDFLQSYDPELRRAMGAYYTPLPIANFIVRHIDSLLKSEFGISAGLTDGSKISYTVEDGQIRRYRDHVTGGRRKVKSQDLEIHRVQILDPATGTGTFLNQVIQFVYSQFEAGQQGMWPSYANEDLIPRLNGFEFMMAPYTIAHLKLGMSLQDSGVADMKQRLRVYLTNTLEEGIYHQPDLFTFGLAEAVTEESRQAGIIKSDRPIMVVLGNPPWAALTSNDSDYANRLVAKYKFEPGGQVRLQERKQWLQDDYLKFLSFAEDMINRSGEGIVGMITNHSYLHNKTSRGVRWHLARTFDKIFVLDLHGNVKLKETSPDGSRDENVFNIQQGSAIILAVKNREGSTDDAEVFFAELWGSRASKFARLDNDQVDWQPIALNKSTYRFTPAPSVDSSEYNEWISVDDLFTVSNSSIVTARDKLVVDIDRATLIKRIEAFADVKFSDEETRSRFFPTRRSRKYPAGDTRGFKLPDARVAVRAESPEQYVKQIGYRPFDSRFIWYSQSMVDWPRFDVGRHMSHPGNVGLVYRRQMPQDNSATYFFISDKIISDGFIKSDNKGSETIAPLFLFDEDGARISNLKRDLVRRLLVSVAEIDDIDDLAIVDYVYGVFHSPRYRSQFHDLLRDDFPRVPPPADDEEFESFRAAGERLRRLHLLVDPALDRFTTTFPRAGSNLVQKVEYIDEEVWINDEQYFGGVTEVAWSFVVGAYRPAEKWLRERVGRELDSGDLRHYQRLVQALIETQAVMDELDSLPAAWVV
ncbi:type ISP restriction/modification enzyme [Mycobacterium avium]|uniref:type ISP restriction/modification enzyme n=1 Tax=Mycobacterium avium TaxID=1764 RepID=UPI0012DA4059|nr:type ISP restriction/modification enzyme [Mycobacterium avium]MBZ4542118.1 hypothetical protein [Mycobacterium avium subsp. hominissuis]